MGVQTLVWTSLRSPAFGAGDTGVALGKYVWVSRGGPPSPHATITHSTVLAFLKRPKDASVS